MKPTFVPATPGRLELLKQALHRNNDGAAMLTDPRTTEFAGVEEGAELTDREVLDAVKSIPCHY
jgi:hypothetical protein